MACILARRRRPTCPAAHCLSDVLSPPPPPADRSPDSTNLAANEGIFCAGRVVTQDGTRLTGFYTYKKDHPLFASVRYSIDESKTQAFREHIWACIRKKFG